MLHQPVAALGPHVGRDGFRAYVGKLFALESFANLNDAGVLVVRRLEGTHDAEINDAAPGGIFRAGGSVWHCRCGGLEQRLGESCSARQKAGQGDRHGSSSYHDPVERTTSADGFLDSDATVLTVVTLSRIAVSVKLCVSGFD